MRRRGWSRRRGRGPSRTPWPAQLNDWDIKTLLEAKSVRRVIKGKEQQQPLPSTSQTKDAQLLPQVPPSLLDSTAPMGKVMDPPNLPSLPGTRGDLVSANGELKLHLHRSEDFKDLLAPDIYKGDLRGPNT